MPILLFAGKSDLDSCFNREKKKLKPLSKLSNCLAFVLPSVTHPRALVEKVFSLQN